MKLKKWFIPIVFTFVMVGVLWLAVSDQSPLRVQSNRTDPLYWETGWEAEDTQGGAQAITPPVRLASTQKKLVNTLPADLAEGTCLYLKTNYQQLHVEIGGEPVPVNGVVSAPGLRLSFDLPWCSVSLTPDMAGKPVAISLSGTGSKPFAEVYTIRLGTVQQVQPALLSRSLPSIILSHLIMLFSVGLFVFMLYERLRYRRRLPGQYYHLLVFLFLAGMWFYSDTDVTGIKYLGSTAFLLVNLFSYLLLPVPFLFYLGSARPALRRATNTLAVLCITNALAQSALILMGHYLLWAGLAASHVLLAACFLTVPIAYFRRNRTPETHNELTLGFGVAVFSGVLTMALFYAVPMEDNSSLFRYGVTVLVLCLIVSLLRTNVNMIMQTARTEQLRVREEEYRIAVRESQKYILRFDIASRAILPGDIDSPLFTSHDDYADMPESAIRAGLVADGSLESFRAFFENIYAGSPQEPVTLNLRTPKGGLGWYRAESTLVFANDGKPLQAVITLSDVTEQRQAELAYRRWKKNFSELPADSIDFYEYDLTRDLFLDHSGALLAPTETLPMQTLNQFMNLLSQQRITPADTRRFCSFMDRERLMDLYAGGCLCDQLDFRRIGENGIALCTQVYVRLMPHPVTGNLSALILIQDEENETQACPLPANTPGNDLLTGLMNRDTMEKAVDSLLESSAPVDTHALLLVDVDGFKRVNVVFGHAFGDKVLKDIANNLRAMLRSEDLIARGEGDAFIIFLKNIHEESDFLERRTSFIYQALSKQFDEGVSITGSLGVSLYPQDGERFAMLYQKSDMAVFFAKRSGKHRPVFFNSGLMSIGCEESGAQPNAYPGGWVQAGGNPAAVPPERTLVLADASPEDIAFLQGILQRDYRLIVKRDAKELLAFLADSSADVSAVLLDTDLPEDNGTALVENMRSMNTLTQLPVIALTEDSDVAMKAVEQGASDVILRPFNPRLVRLRVKNVIRRQETEDLRMQNRMLVIQKSDEARHQNELRYIAEHDPLTGICNKAAFYRKTKLMLDQAPESNFLMIAFDIEKFRLINDIFGHEEGNRLLRYIAQKMQSLFSGVGTYGRIDADNFALCLPYNAQDLQNLITSSDRDLREYGLPFEILLVYGLYAIDDRTLPVNIMHDRAEMAKRTVKGNYLKRYAYYDDQLRQALLDEQQIINDMTTALHQKQFILYLQPKCVLSTGEIIGAEALVRWNHPTRGLLMPGKFVPIFEKNGFIMKMDSYVWEQVYLLLRRWMDRNPGKAPLPVSMNVSRVDIYNPALVSILCDLADRYRVPRRFVELEITESAYTEDPKQLSELIATLRREGFIVEMDDFGSAYSSLNMLKEIPVDSLKLDMRFLYGNDRDGRGGTILSSIVRMARYLSLPIIAEGVETAPQARFLSSIGCSLGQGYLYYKPMPVPEFEQLIATLPEHRPLEAVTSFPESAVRRVWSIDGDFSLMLSTIPCAASLCEMNGDKIELMRINDEYLKITGDRETRIYQSGTDVRNLTTEEDYRQLLTLFRSAFETQGSAEGDYHRICENGSCKRLRLKIKFLTGDAVRSLYFLTYLPYSAESCEVVSFAPAETAAEATAETSQPTERRRGLLQKHEKEKADD